VQSACASCRRSKVPAPSSPSADAGSQSTSWTASKNEILDHFTTITSVELISHLFIRARFPKTEFWRSDALPTDSDKKNQIKYEKSDAKRRNMIH